MGSKNNSNDNEVLAQYAASVSVDREILNLGSVQLDAAVSDAKKANAYLDETIALQNELMELLSAIEDNGITDGVFDEIAEFERGIDLPDVSQHHLYEQVKTQEIVHSYDEMVESNQEFAQLYGLDLSNPFTELFSNYERAVVSNELAEKFDLLRLNKYDYAFATAVGLIGGIVDAVLIGTAGNDSKDMGKLAQLTDKSFDKLVQVYAKHCGWPGPKKGSNPTKSAIGYLEREFRVNYDQRYSKDIDNAFSGMNLKNHHLLSMSHSGSILGLIFGIFDLLQNKATFFDGEKIIRVASEKANHDINHVDSVIEAVQRWFSHAMSDISGGSGAKGRGMGLPTGMQTVLQTFQFGKIPIKESGKGVEYATIGNAVKAMYENGFDFRFSVATAIPVIVCEVIIRLYWFFKQHFYYGKSIKNSLPFGKDRELQRLLLISSLSFATVDVTHGLIKGYTEQNPVTLLNSLNYINLANLGYKLFVNFRLEHEHNEKVKKIIETEAREKYEQLINSNYLL